VKLFKILPRKNSVSELFSSAPSNTLSNFLKEFLPIKKNKNTRKTKPLVIITTVLDKSIFPFFYGFL
jgi:hypothetical protein